MIFPLSMFDAPIWGLDLGSTSVRVLKLAPRGDAFQIVGVDRIDTFRDPMHSSAEELDAALRKALDAFRRNHRIGSADRIGVALPGLGFETTVLHLPAVSPSRIGSLVDYELRARAGQAANDLVFAHRELPSLSMHERRVLVASGAAGVVGGYLEALRAAGIEADRVTIAPLAFVDAMRADGVDLLTALAVRIGTGMTDIVAQMPSDHVVRTDPEGTLWITRALRERFGLGEQEAEAARRSLEAGGGDPRFDAVVKEFASRLARRIDTVRELARDRNPAYAPSRILIAGEGGRIARLVGALHAELGTAVEVHRNWNRITIAKSLFGHSLAAEIPSLVVAAGAALDAAGASASSLSFVHAGTGREASRRAPLVAASALALVAGSAGGAWIAKLDEAEVRAGAASADAIGADLRARNEIALRIVREDERIAESQKALGLPLEAALWQRALNKPLESLTPHMIVLDARWLRTDDGIQLDATVAVPRLEAPAAASASAVDTNTPATFSAAVEQPLAAAGCANIRLIDQRAVKSASLSAPADAAGARFDLYHFAAVTPFPGREAAADGAADPAARENGREGSGR